MGACASARLRARDRRPPARAGADPNSHAPVQDVAVGGPRMFRARRLDVRATNRHAAPGPVMPSSASTPIRAALFFCVVSPLGGIGWGSVPRLACPVHTSGRAIDAPFLHAGFGCDACKPPCKRAFGPFSLKAASCLLALCRLGAGLWAICGRTTGTAGCCQMKFALAWQGGICIL